MNKPIEDLKVHKAVDSVQQRLTDYAYALSYQDLPAEVVHVVKTRVIDTLGALLIGFYGEPCMIARNLAAQMPNCPGASVIGTRMKTTPDMAAFVNGTTARYVELNDFYYRPGSGGGHPSDVMAPLVAAAEHSHGGGRDFITAVALAYEIYLRVADTGVLPGFDTTNYACLGAAAAAGKLIGLTSEQLAHCISMAIVPNNALLQSRSGFLTMWKEVAAGQAGRAAMFAALLAQAGMEGPHLPFEGKAGWCDHVAKKRFTLDTMGGAGSPFKIMETSIKERPCCASTISSVLAAEGVMLPSGSMAAVKEITVEVYEKAKRGGGTGDHHWHPDSRDTADHSIPYVVAATLMHGTVKPGAFDNAHLWDPEQHALMQKIKVVENDEFTEAHKRLPALHRTRVTVVTDGGRWVGETGIGDNDVMAPKSDAQIEDKFCANAEDLLGAKRTRSILDRLWNLDEIKDVAEIPSALVFV